MATTRLAAILFAVLVGLASVQAEPLNAGMWKSAEACQKVARKDSTLVKSIIDSSQQQFKQTADLLKGYVHRYGARVVAADPKTAEVVRQCLQAFDADVQAAEDRMTAALAAKDVSAARWYDEQIFNLLTGTMSDVTMAKVVRQVQEHLKSSNSTFRNQALSAVRDAVKELKPTYQTVSRCIREQSLTSQ